MNKLRSLWESVVYVGMKPGSAPFSIRLARRFGPLRGPVEHFLTGGLSPDDPLYLTNRSLAGRLRVLLVMAVPCLLLVAVISLPIGAYIRAHHKVAPPLTNAEIAAKMLPHINAEEIHIASNRDLEVVNATVHDGHIVSGAVRNNTDHPIDDATVIFDLTNKYGARLGAIAAKVAHVSPRETATFQVSVEQQDAAYALVREIRVR
jgi:hypothetical protein